MRNIRWFKVINANKIINNNKYKIKEHEILGKNNRYKIDINKGQTPINAAEKALSKIFLKMNKNNFKLNLILRETTHKSGNKLFFYKGSRKLLDENEWKKATFKSDKKGNKLKKPKIKYFKYKIEILPKSFNELNHCNPLSDWRTK